MSLLRLLSGALAVLLFTGFAAANMSFGSYVVQEDITTSSNATFEIQVMNLADEDVKVNIRSTSNDNIQINHEEQIILKPSITTEKPSKHDSSINWFLLEDGRYVETETIKINTKSSELGTKNFEVKLSAGQRSPSYKDNEEGYSLEQKVTQSRTYDFEVNFKESTKDVQDDVNSNSPTGSKSGSSGEERQSRLQTLRQSFERFTQDNSDDESEIGVKDSEETEDSGSSSDEVTSDTESESESTDDAAESLTGMFSAAQSSEKTTFILIAGILGSIIYLVTSL